MMPILYVNGAYVCPGPRPLLEKMARAYSMFGSTVEIRTEANDCIQKPHVGAPPQEGSNELSPVGLGDAEVLRRGGDYTPVKQDGEAWQTPLNPVRPDSMSWWQAGPLPGVGESSS